MKPRIAFLLMLVAFSSVVGASDKEYNLAVTLTQERQFERALPIFKKLSVEGDMDAQNNLGAMYQNGHGVPVDNSKAAYWYLRSAQNGNNVAQHNIGIAYFYGNGVKQSESEGLAWMLMSVWGGLHPSESFAKRMKVGMSPQQIERSSKRLVELNAKYGIYTKTPPPFRLE